jgi:hypothetical protein
MLVTHTRTPLSGDRISVHQVTSNLAEAIILVIVAVGDIHDPWRLLLLRLLGLGLASLGIHDLLLLRRRLRFGGFHRIHDLSLSLCATRL